MPGPIRRAVELESECTRLLQRNSLARYKYYVVSWLVNDGIMTVHAFVHGNCGSCEISFIVPAILPTRGLSQLVELSQPMSWPIDALFVVSVETIFEKKKRSHDLLFEYYHEVSSTQSYEQNRSS